MAAALPIGSTSRARSAVHGTLQKPFTHACKLLGPPKFKHARARPGRADLWRHWERCDPAAGHCSRARRAGPLRGAALPAPRPARSSGDPGWTGPRGAATPGARGAPRAGWAPAAGTARGGDGAGRRARGEGETGRDRRAGEGRGGLRAAVTDPARRDGARLRPPHSLTSPVHAAAHGCCRRDSHDEDYWAT